MDNIQQAMTPDQTSGMEILVIEKPRSSNWRTSRPRKPRWWKGVTLDAMGGTHHGCHLAVRSISGFLHALPFSRMQPAVLSLA
jgi:hypothetical protein